jgi:hypothetical protein
MPKVLCPWFNVIDYNLFQVTHWQHPRFHAYFPSGNSYPSILGDMLSDAIGCIGFSWVRNVLSQLIKYKQNVTLFHRYGLWMFITTCCRQQLVIHLLMILCINLYFISTAVKQLWRQVYVIQWCSDLTDVFLCRLPAQYALNWRPLSWIG